jgi:hypothetical protein
MNFSKNSKQKNIICNNCRQAGHKYYECDKPIVSCGIILFCRNHDRHIYYLMVRRKVSFGFNDLLLGSYEVNDIQQIQEFIDEMTIFEKEQALSKEYMDLWLQVWSTAKPICIKAEEKFSEIQIETHIQNSKTVWTEPEWEFPKGRRYMHETDLHCAKREFSEETGISIMNINVIENIEPFEETFQGSDHKLYTNRFYLAYYSGDISSLELTNFQVSEISKLEWKDILLCNRSIRETSHSKIELINTVHKVIESFTFY